MTALLFPGIFLAILGPRIGSVDFVVLGVLYLGSISVLAAPIRVSREMLVVIGWQLVYLAYVHAVYAATGQSDAYLLARTYRTLLSTIVLAVVFSSLPVSPVRTLKLVLAALAVHALMIFVQLMMPGLRERIAHAYGFATYFVRWRAMGLTSGYDGAALLCLIGLALSAIQLLRGGWGLFWAASVPLFAAAALFTGRTGMMFAVLITTAVALHFAFRGRGAARLGSVVLLAGAAVVGLFFVRVVVVQTIPELRPWLGEPTMAAENFAFSNQFAPHTGDVLQKMLVLPSTAQEVLFGTGSAPEWIDIGWVRIVFMTGLVGFLPIAAFYGYMFVRSLLLAHRYLQLNTPAGRRLAATGSGLAAILAIMMFYNMKSLFFFARSTHEIFVMLFASLAADSARRAWPPAASDRHPVSRAA